MVKISVSLQEINICQKLCHLMSWRDDCVCMYVCVCARVCVRVCVCFHSCSTIGRFLSSAHPFLELHLHCFSWTFVSRSRKVIEPRPQRDFKNWSASEKSLGSLVCFAANANSLPPHCKRTKQSTNRFINAYGCKMWLRQEGDSGPVGEMEIKLIWKGEGEMLR